MNEYGVDVKSEIATINMLSRVTPGEMKDC